MSIDQRDPVAAATSPYKLCPFWSRVAQTKRGLLALCSFYDLEDQQARGYGEPEGWTRLANCPRYASAASALARDMPEFRLNGNGISIPGNEAVGPDFDRAWEIAVAWANEEVEE